MTDQKTCSFTGRPCNCEAKVRGSWCWDSLRKGAEHWKAMRPGDIIDAPICGRATLVRHTTQSGIDGVEVMHADGRPRYLNYVDLDLSADEIAEINRIWKQRRAAAKKEGT